VRILIAEDDLVSRYLLAKGLVEWGHEVVVTRDGLEAWDAVQADDAPVLAIFDWMMPGLDGPELCRKIRQDLPALPIYLILLTGRNSKEDLLGGLEAGADDYLTKPFDPNELKVRIKVGSRIIELQSSMALRVRELEVAVQDRKRAEEALLNLTLTDDLTGLYNRRGFFTLAEYHARTLQRTGQGSLLIYADMDGLKQINDTFGHQEGSVAIANAAAILRQTFRESDIVARLGGDEFAVLAPNVSPDEILILTSRLAENLRRHNVQHDSGYALSLSIGTVCFAPNIDLTIEELVSKADAAMYLDKRSKRSAGLMNAYESETLATLADSVVNGGI
jgi:two-component system cell cycle response regulator